LEVYYLCIEEAAQAAIAGHDGYKMMEDEPKTRTAPGEPVVYQIRLKGQLGSEWTNWFGGLAITLEENGDTLLTGPVVDQAALHGVLRKVRDLGMPLISVCPVEPGPPATLPLRGLGGTSQADESEVKA
jgi:hypothetical protein